MKKDRRPNALRKILRVALALAAAGAAALIYNKGVASQPVPFSAPVTEKEGSRMSSIDTEITKPDTEEKFLKNLKSAVDDSSIFRHDFYTQESLYRYFAAVNIAGGVERGDHNDSRIWARAGDFDGIFPHLKREGASGPIVNGQIAVGLSVNATGDEEGYLTFLVQESNLSFERVKSIFDKELILDKSIPHEPPPPPLGPHANEGWWYVSEKNGEAIRGLLQFDSSGFLKGASFTLNTTKGH